MKIDKEDGLVERHFTLFGAIVHAFALYEALVLDLVAEATGSDASAMMLATRKLDFADKRAALIDLLRHRPMPKDQYDRICDFLAVPKMYQALRDDIIHSTWTRAKAPQFVQPTWIFTLPEGVRPQHGDPADVGARFQERIDDTIAYSLDDLATAAQRLGDNYRQFVAYTREAPLPSWKATPALTSAPPR